jgi:hypothetical protein
MAGKGVKGSPASDCGMMPPRPMAKALAKITGQVPRAVAEPSGGHLPSSESAHRRVRTQSLLERAATKGRARCFRFGTTSHLSTRFRLPRYLA